MINSALDVSLSCSKFHEAQSTLLVNRYIFESDRPMWSKVCQLTVYELNNRYAINYEKGVWIVNPETSDSIIHWMSTKNIGSGFTHKELNYVLLKLMPSDWYTFEAKVLSKFISSLRGDGFA